jgi:hypothetical protein
MKFKFINPGELDRNLKATVHKTGKLGFTVEAAKKLDLSAGKSVMIALNDDDKEDNNLYIIVVNDVRPDGFRVSKAGGYYYLNTKDLFENLNIEYILESVVYDIREMLIDGVKGFVLKRRVNDKENKKKDDEIENNVVS